jgi:hypothetical protein
MVFYYVLPVPVLFEREFIFSIFPNLQLEHTYLVSIGREEFANYFVNYQANMVLLFLVVSLSIYIIFIPIFIWKKYIGSITKLSWLFTSVPFCIVTYMYLFGIWPADRIGWQITGGNSRIDVDGKGDYFILIAFLVLGSICLTVSIFALVEKTLNLASKIPDSERV